jgi:two-component system chemotaxis response regulator CheB
MAMFDRDTIHEAPVRDTIAIGTSAGGVEALRQVLGPLGHEVRAAVLIVQHLSPVHDPYLVDILRHATSLPVDWAEQGTPIEHGRIYIAPRNVHMMIEGEHLRLSGGPRENHARPSIDRLFRSAAAMRGPRTIGVLLTGMLDDGVSGLRDIQSAGGLALVQDPQTAAFPELPGRALVAMQADQVLALDAMGAALGRLAGTRGGGAAKAGTGRPRGAIELEASIDRLGPTDPETMDRLGRRVQLSCPDCDGPMWDIGDAHHRRYRCYLGHVATAREIVRQSGRHLETALWSAVRALHDRAATYETLADDALRQDQKLAHDLYRQRAGEAMTQAELARRFLLDLVDEP